MSFRFAPALLFALSLATGTAARASVLDYFKGYQVGADYTSTGGASTLSYDAPLVSPVPRGCVADPGGKQIMHCQAVISSALSHGFGAFVEQTFKREGLTYFEADLRFAYFGLDASLDKTDPDIADQPVHSASLHLYGVNTEGYLKFGLTPLYIPDVFLSLGLGAQAATGNIKVDGFKESVNLVVPHLYGEIEFVWIRAGRASLSSYFDVEADAGEQEVYKRPIHGLSKFSIAQSAATLGLIKLVLPFP